MEIGYPKKKLILVVEDEVSIQTLMLAVLSSNYEVLLAEDGVEAKGVYLREEKKIAAIITDVIMPKMNGIEFIEWLNKRGVNIPIIVMSADRGGVDIKGYRGKVEFESKPFKISEMRDRLKKLLENGSRQ